MADNYENMTDHQKYIYDTLKYFEGLRDQAIAKTGQYASMPEWKRQKNLKALNDRIVSYGGFLSTGETQSTGHVQGELTTKKYEPTEEIVTAEGVETPELPAEEDDIIMKIAGISSFMGIDPNDTISKAFAKYRVRTGENISFSDFKPLYEEAKERSQGQVQNVAPSPTSSPTSTTSPTNTGSSGIGTTYLSAKRNGFIGSFDDWVAAGRPSGGVSNTNTGSSSNNNNTGSNSPIFDSDAATQEALRQLEASPFYQNLPEDQKALLRMTVQSWNPDKEINMNNVLAEFERIKRETIDPQFAEQVQVFSDDVRTAYGNLGMARGMELEQERYLAGEGIKQARAGLEKSGMTFTGEGIEQLGGISAYAQPSGPQGHAYVGYVNGQLQSFPSEQAALDAGATGLTQNSYFLSTGQPGVVGSTPNGLQFFSSVQAAEANGATNITELSSGANTPMPTQTPFGGLFYEGTVNQANRLMQTASQQRYMENLRSLGRQAENQLGSQAAMGLVPGYTPAGVSTGQIDIDRQRRLGSTLSGLANQQNQLNTYQQPLDFSGLYNVFNN